MKLSEAIFILEIALRFLPPVAFLLYPLLKKDRPSLLKGAFSVACVIGLAVFTGAIFHRDPQIDTWLKITVAVVFTTLCVLFAFFPLKCTIPQAAFLFFICTCYTDIVTVIVPPILMLLPDLLGSGTELWHMAIALLISAASIPALKQFTKKLLYPVFKLSTKSGFWKHLWIVPCSFFFIYRTGISADYHNFSIPSATGLALAWAVGVAISNCIILRLVLVISRDAEIKEQLHLSQLQYAARESEYQAMQRNSEEIKRLHHDMRHQLLAVSQFVRNGENAAALSFLEKYVTTLLIRQEEAFCENRTVNMIINHYVSFANKNEVGIQIEAELPEAVEMTAVDLNVIFGNLFENALEGALRSTQQNNKRYIKVKIGMSGNMLTAVIRNSFCGEIKRQDGHFLSSKREGKGVGISSVKRIIKARGGVFRAEYTNDEFSVSILVKA